MEVHIYDDILGLLTGFLLTFCSPKSYVDLVSNLPTLYLVR